MSEPDVYAQLLHRVPGYTPGWTPQEHTAGAALLRIVAGYADVLAEGLRELPERSRTAFLDRLGVELRPAQPARTPLVFDLLPDGRGGAVPGAAVGTGDGAVALPAGTQVARPAEPAVAPSGSTPRETLFAVDESITLTGARVASLYSVDPVADEWADHTAAQRTGFTAFGGLGPVEHALYLGHDADLALAGDADITLSVDVSGSGAQRRDLSYQWDYLSEHGWLPLEVVEDRTGRLTRSGMLRLRKACGPDSHEETIAGHPSYWIRARTSRAPITATVEQSTTDGVVVDAPGHLRVDDRVTLNSSEPMTITGISGRAVALRPAPTDVDPGALLRLADPPAGLEPIGTGGTVGLPRLGTIRARVGFTRAGLEPELTASDGLPVDPNATFAPFGHRPAPFATLYLASKDVFTRRGAEIGVHVALRRPGVATPGEAPQLAFEYFDGSAWTPLLAVRDGTQGFTADAETLQPVVFGCPPDWAPVAVNGERNHWMRIRLDAGGYGRPEAVTIDPGDPQKVVFTAGTLVPPLVAQVRLSYTFQTELTALHHCLAYNDFRFTDHTDDARWPQRSFEPFRPIADERPALHVGFDRALPVGLVGMYVDVAEEPAEVAEQADHVWEYASHTGWSALAVRDETAGLRRSGMIQIVGPRDAVAVDGHNGRLFRIRARLKSVDTPAPAGLNGLWTNAVWAQERRRYEREVLGSSDGGARQSYFVPRERLPVLAGEQVEVREWSGRGQAWRTVVAGVDPADLAYDHDPGSGEIRAVWVRWAPRAHLYAAGPADRRYTIERANGLLRFGDGRHGRIPPAGSLVRAGYAAGGGTGGNGPAGVVTELRAAVVNVVGVTNVAAATGGAGTEDIERARERGAASLRHRDRALSADDVEWLAREASPAVARARCLPLLGPDGPQQRGYVSVLVVPDGAEARPSLTPELARRVRAYLTDRVPAPVAGRVRVLGPRYATVRVVAEVVPSAAGAAAEVEQRLLRRIEDFLHPVRGRHGRGWGFGQAVYQSEIAALVEDTDGVDHALRLHLEVDGALAGEIAPVPPTAVVASGRHEIGVVLGGER